MMEDLSLLLENARIFRPMSKKIMENFIKDPTPLSRREICDKFDLKWTTAHDNLKPLVLNGFLTKVDRLNVRGRPTVLFKLNKEIFY